LIKIYQTRRPKDKVWIRVSKKVSKKAVTRNKIKRRIQAILREVDRDLTPYVISALSGADQAGFSQLRAALLSKINELYIKA